MEPTIDTGPTRPEGRNQGSEVLPVAVESVDRELAFYRGRSGQIYLVSLSAEALIIVGKEQVQLPGTEWWVPPLVLTIAFLAVAVVGTVLGAEYRRRIHRLKDARQRLFSGVGSRDVHPDPHQRRVSEIQVLYFVLWFTSGGAAIIGWLRAAPANLVVWATALGYALAILAAAIYGLWQSFFHGRPNKALHPTAGTP